MEVSTFPVRHSIKQTLNLKKLKEKITNGPIGEGRVPRWYFGGVASMAAACFTHPLDTMKVYYQTCGALAGDQSLIGATRKVIKYNGFLSLYNGLSASILRQMTYSTARFGIYDCLKQTVYSGMDDKKIPFLHRIILAGVSGACGGLVGAPADLINVRMQNDIKLPPELKRNYKHAIDGLVVIAQNEGIASLFRGCSMALARSVLISIGQLAMYDQYKKSLVNLSQMNPDSIKTHITASFFTGITCTLITQPVDVLKTRLMNQSGAGCRDLPGTIIELYKADGISGFFRGFAPAFIRIGPQTILVYLLYEQLRIHFGQVRSLSPKSL